MSDTPTPLGGPAEDRSAAPQGYYIDCNDYAHWPDLDLDPPQTGRAREDAIAAAWAHRDRIVASATAELRQQLAKMVDAYAKASCDAGELAVEAAELRAELAAVKHDACEDAEGAERVIAGLRAELERTRMQLEQSRLDAKNWHEAWETIRSRRTSKFAGVSMEQQTGIRGDVTYRVVMAKWWPTNDEAVAAYEATLESARAEERAEVLREVDELAERYRGSHGLAHYIRRPEFRDALKALADRRSQAAPAAPAEHVEYDSAGYPHKVARAVPPAPTSGLGHEPHLGDCGADCEDGYRALLDRLDRHAAQPAASAAPTSGLGRFETEEERTTPWEGLSQMAIESQTCVPHARFRCAECLAALTAQPAAEPAPEVLPSQLDYDGRCEHCGQKIARPHLRGCAFLRDPNAYGATAEPPPAPTVPPAEPTEPGWYWAMLDDDGGWVPIAVARVEHRDGRVTHVSHYDDRVLIWGPRIEPPPPSEPAPQGDTGKDGR